MECILLAEDYYKDHKKNIPINAAEGLVRQIIGWREFIYGVYWRNMPEYKSLNYWNHKNQLKDCWYDGTTGIPPLDDAIRQSHDLAYTHHINRLMIISNMMNLCRVDPSHMYEWFMEMYIDSADWVMVPNVYGMGTFADGGIFSTKPYICGSSYMLKMSNYKKDVWCDIVDGLYWKFISDNEEFFKSNPRLGLMVNALKKIKEDRKTRIFNEAESFIDLVTK
jgi:deoxyribodipyrimidine photolyase-related protein